MHFTCRSFIGSHTASNWSQYWENEPDDPLLVSKKGHLFGLININLESDTLDVKSIGHDIIFEINQNYFSSEDNNILLCLQKSIETILSNPLYRNFQISIVLAVVYNNNLFLSSCGPIQAVLVRGLNIASLLAGEEDIKNISGPILPEDKLFITTSEFITKIGWDKIKSTLSEEKIQNIEENFLSLLYSTDDQTDLAAALIQPHLDEINQPVSTDLEMDNELYQTPNITTSVAKAVKKLPKINLTPLITKLSFLFKRRPKSDKSDVFVAYRETRELSKRKKINLFIIILLIIGLGVSSYFGYQKNKSSQIEHQYQNLKIELDKKINESISVRNLNIDSALELAQQAQSVYQKLESLNVHSQELSQYQANIVTLLNQTGAAEGFSPPMFYDTSLITNNQNYSKIIYRNNNFYLLDNENGRLDSVSIEKSTKNISMDPKLKTALNLDESNGNIYIFDITGIHLVTKTSIDSKITFDESITSPTDFQFWNGAVYVLNGSNLWKYNPNSSGFSSAQKWLKDGQSLIPNSISLAINGKIWVLSSDGQIVPYLTGSKDSFNPQQNNKLSQTNNLTTTLESEILAFTDSGNIIYIYKKTGELLSRFNLGSLQILDIAIDEKTNTIYSLCSDQKIYKISF